MNAKRLVLGGCLALVLLGGGGMLAGGSLVAAGAAGGLYFLTAAPEATELAHVEAHSTVDEEAPTIAPLDEAELREILEAIEEDLDTLEDGAPAAPAQPVSRVPAVPPAPTGGEPTGTVAREGTAEPARNPKTGSVTVEGDADVTLVGDGSRYPVPGAVPPGRYRIEATFPGEPALDVGPITVDTDDSTITCNARMGICRASS